MEYVQERIATLHDLTGHVPDAPLERTAVVVPMTEREYATLAAERVLSELEGLDPGTVIVPLRASADRVPAFAEWLESFELDLEMLWCSGERVQALLDEHGLNGSAGKGRDVWLALGIAAEEQPYIVCHDSDTRSYTGEFVTRLLAPLDRGFDFTKGYYARVEEGRLYGRLFRLFYTPLVTALRDRTDGPILEYLAAFRYALAGEFAGTRELIRQFNVERRFGLEVGILGDAFGTAGFEGTAQVDLGRYEHDHRAVGGPTGLSEMSEDVGAAILRIVEANGIDPDYSTLPEAYEQVATDYIDRYAADAWFNRLEYDVDAEREQVDTYTDAIRPPETDDRLPSWETASMTPAAVRTAAREDVDALP
ncbi:MAG: glycosyl transferase family 2 [Halobacteriales archaeon]